MIIHYTGFKILQGSPGKAGEKEAAGKDKKWRRKI